MITEDDAVHRLLAFRALAGVGEIFPGQELPTRPAGVLAELVASVGERARGVEPLDAGRVSSEVLRGGAARKEHRGVLLVLVGAVGLRLELAHLGPSDDARPDAEPRHRVEDYRERGLRLLVADGSGEERHGAHERLPVAGPIVHADQGQPVAAEVGAPEFADARLTGLPGKVDDVDEEERAARNRDDVDRHDGADVEGFPQGLERDAHAIGVEDALWANRAVERLGSGELAGEALRLVGRNEGDRLESERLAGEAGIGRSHRYLTDAGRFAVEERLGAGPAHVDPGARSRGRRGSLRRDRRGSLRRGGRGSLLRNGARASAGANEQREGDAHATLGPFQNCIDFTSRNSSSPNLPSSRPRPDCLKPPNGARGLKRPPLMSTCPVRSRRATRSARAASEDPPRPVPGGPRPPPARGGAEAQPPPASPYMESCAIRTASSSSSYGRTESTG